MCVPQLPQGFVVIVFGLFAVVCQCQFYEIIGNGLKSGNIIIDATSYSKKNNRCQVTVTRYDDEIVDLEIEENPSHTPKGIYFTIKEHDSEAELDPNFGYYGNISSCVINNNDRKKLIKFLRDAADTLDHNK